ncbi:hypothetical protein [Bacteriovorax sp. Seq25_V]|uniref:hypothetical protein n=1 Tax=Bacteriovorax sp. Seq25_V TaxID=1201288 RepID=UPI000389E784|nr:hypothetical protein [Bacteriovorax sp. Seq25_V]EQC48028.1 hypothetical protein M900_1085 [Bacteriovorax sp. Seq25_V]
MKKLIIGAVLLSSSMSAAATDFSFDRKYSLKLPVNSERIGAIVELKDYFELNPKLSGVAVKINNLSFQYKGFSKSDVKSKICVQVGKLEFFKERFDILKGRVLSDAVPRLLNKEQSRLSEQFSILNTGLSNTLSDLTSFCEGDLNLDGKGIRDSLNGLSSLIHDTAFNVNWALERDSILVPQASDTFIEYSRAKHIYDNTVETEEDGDTGKKECRFRDLF